MDAPIKEEDPSTTDEASSSIVGHGKPLPFVWDSCSKEPLRSRVSTKQQAVDDAFRHAKSICSTISSALADKESETFKELYDQEIVALMDEIRKSDRAA